MGASATLGEDQGKSRLVVGDTFELGDRWWKVIGLMKTRGTTYGSEIWTGVESPVVRATGKGDKFTTLVLRMADDSDDSAKAMAFFLTEHKDDCTVGGLLHLYVPDVDAWHSEFVGRGIAIHEPPNQSLPGLRDMTIIDPDGNKLRI